MAHLAHKCKLRSFIPVAPIALQVSLEGEGKNAAFVDCKIIEGTPQTVGKFEKLHMLSGMRRNAREVWTHFLSGLEHEVHFMFTDPFPIWLEDKKLNEGYTYVSKLQEIFNTVTWIISQYAKFH
ncbi:hypothetical protein H4S08_004830 [Coemansia sp. RSA 1365]|nr:hypothetical protein H4S08_004830 [Coemansia sp. RSA 1365]